jgi:hypothetical protein
MKATFEKELEVGRNIAEALPAPPPPQIAPPPDEHERLLRWRSMRRTARSS